MGNCVTTEYCPSKLMKESETGNYCFPLGCVVQIVGLVTSTQYNGRNGTIITLVDTKNRQKLRLHGENNKVLNIDINHLMLFDRLPAPMATEIPDEQIFDFDCSSVNYRIGQRVLLHGLHNRVELNGLSGTLVSRGRQNRFNVRLVLPAQNTYETVSVNRRNIVPEAEFALPVQYDVEVA